MSKPAAYTAMSIQPHPGGYIVIEIEFDEKDKPTKITKSPPTSWFMAAHNQKRRAAELWTHFNKEPT